MILMGDEVRRTQYGNNNPYCQDNKTSWFDWTLLEKHAEVHRYLRLLIERRLLRDTEAELQRQTLHQMLQAATKAWHGVKVNQPDWSDDSRTFAFGATLPNENLIFHLIANAYWNPLDFELPPVNNGCLDPWRRWIDTSIESPHDIVSWQVAPSIPGYTYRVGPRSVVVLHAAINLADHDSQPRSRAR
jgi:isoamylase